MEVGQGNKERGPNSKYNLGSKLRVEAPGWYSWLSVQLLVSAQVMISGPMDVVQSLLEILSP